MAATRAQRALGVAMSRDAAALTTAMRRDLAPVFRVLAAAAADAYTALAGEPKNRKADDPGPADRVIAGMAITDWSAKFAPAYERHYQRVGSRTVKTINGALDLDVSITDLAMQRLRSEGVARTRLLDIEGDTRAAIMRAIRDGVAAGDNPRTIARRIRAQVPAGRFVNAGAKYRATLIARTETLHAQRLSALEAYEASDIVTSVVAIDGDDDEDCAARNGAAFTFAEARAEVEHPQGTLTWVPVVG